MQPYYQDNLVTLYHGDARDIVPQLPPRSVQCIVTSPPYFGLRRYSNDEREIGGEPTPAEYVAHLVEVFDAAWDVLTDDGTLWLNLGDSYANDTKWGGRTSGKHAAGLQGSNYIGRNRRNTGLPSKSLIGIPWRVAFALQDAGWVLRNEIIWHKPSVMPESVTDRLTRDHETMFLFTKQPHYYFDAAAIAEPAKRVGDTQTFGGNKGRQYIPTVDDPNFRNGTEQYGRTVTVGATRNRRTVWRIAAQPLRDEHFAPFPEALVEPCILAGSRPGDTVLDMFAGSGTTMRVAERFGRNSIGIDLSQTYLKIQERRTNGVQMHMEALL